MHKISKNFTLALGQLRVYPGQPEKNATSILRWMDSAASQGVSLLLLPEMAVPGYLLGDAWERPDFLRECDYWNQEIIAASKEVTIAFGTVITDWEQIGEDGRPRKYNGAILAQKGQALLNPALNAPFFVKTLHPNYREFDDTRHFFDLRKLAQEQHCSTEDLLKPIALELPTGILKMGLTICEDGWSQNYGLDPFKILKDKGAELLINLSCSPYTSHKNWRRNQVFSEKAQELQTPIIYVNQVGLQNNGKTLFTFEGASTVYNNMGNICDEGSFYSEELRTLSWPLPQSKVSTSPRPSRRDLTSEHFAALTYGAKVYMEDCGIQKVVIGASGGIDSAVTAALYRAILPSENILLVNMPSRYNSNTTIDLSRKLAENLQCLYTEIGIEDSVALTKNQIHGLQVSSRNKSSTQQLELTDFHIENVQARDRSSRILSALSSAFGGVFSCNANKAEMTIGYSTLYGDLSGFLALIGDLWKGEVYALGQYLNEVYYKQEIIPQGIFDVKPSAELSTEQNVDEGRGDPLYYPYHDRLFHSWIQQWNRVTPAENLRWYSEGSLLEKLDCKMSLQELFPTAKHFIDDLEKWWNLYNGMGVAKRVQAPPIIAVSSRSFGFDHRESLGAPFYSREYKQLKEQILSASPKSEPLRK